MIKNCSIKITICSVFAKYGNYTLTNWSQQVMVDGLINRLTWCQECRRPVFWDRYCSSCTYITVDGCQIILVCGELQNSVGA